MDIEKLPVNQTAKKVIRNLGDGLSICEFPYNEISRKLDLSVEQISTELNDLVNLSLVQRFGPILNPKSWGYFSCNILICCLPEYIEDVVAEVFLKDLISDLYISESRYKIGVVYWLEGEQSFENSQLQKLISELNQMPGVTEVRVLIDKMVIKNEPRPS